MTPAEQQRGNPRISFRAPAHVMAEVEARQDAMSAIVSGEGDAPLGSTARRDLERYYQVVRDELVRAPLTRNEVLLIMDALNGVIIEHAGGYRGALIADVVDHIRLNAADAKWVVSAAVLEAKLREMRPGTMMALIDASERFWARASEDAEVVLRELGLWREKASAS